MLLGFRANRPHTLTLTLTDASGAEIEAAQLTMQSPELPWETAPVDIRVADTDRMEPGLHLIPLFRWFGTVTDTTYGQILVVDAEGEIVWLYEAPHTLVEVKLLENGNILYMRDFTMTEIDWLGNEINHWHPTRTVRNAADGSLGVDVDTFHHDVLEMPSGNLLGLSTEVREIENWYTSETDPDAPRETRNVIGDVLYEIERDGTVVNEWKFFDLIDNYRIGYDSLNTEFYAQQYDGILDEPAPDWTHMNGIDYDPETNTALISSNHLSTVMQLDLTSGELDWLLGDTRDWGDAWTDLLLEREDENMIWSYHHHAPKWTPAGTLLLYDNGAARARPPDPPAGPLEMFSRAVEYAIDEDTGTVREVWSYGGPGGDIFVSPFISEADWLPQTENILLTNGGSFRLPDGVQLDLSNPEAIASLQEQVRLWVELVEVTHTSPAERIWELAIDDPRWGWTAFRTERIPRLNPKGQ
jgi:hypothetical protein